MQFIAKYIAKTKPEYYRTIRADTEPDADRAAKKYRRKGYIVASLKQSIGKE